MEILCSKCQSVKSNLPYQETLNARPPIEWPIDVYEGMLRPADEITCITSNGPTFTFSSVNIHVLCHLKGNASLHMTRYYFIFKSLWYSNFSGFNYQKYLFLFIGLLTWPSIALGHYRHERKRSQVTKGVFQMHWEEYTWSCFLLVTCGFVFWAQQNL